MEDADLSNNIHNQQIIMIKIYNRHSKSYEEENIVGKRYIQWTYESPIGKRFSELILKKKLFSKLYGAYCDTKISSKKIPCFIHDYNIDIKESIKSENDFISFNDFFTRKLLKTARPIDLHPNILISPGDGRLMVYEDIDLDNVIQIKNLTYSLRELINDDCIAEQYKKGTCIILRLAPIDYHRFHFIDSGTPTKSTKIDGYLYSVNPIALNNIPKLFCENKREWSIFKSDNFDDILTIEVGATCVGSIIQTYTPDKKVNKGDEKGYFKFGGSTTILFFKKDTINIDEDIIQQSHLGFETKVLFGETIGYKK